ncbi:MAG: nuclear transport factor 2 family protein [Nocardioidaceae bacterium]
MSNVDVVRALFEAYLTQDRPTAEALVAEPLVFTSPQDDHIDRDAYFSRCFPTADRLRSQMLLHLAELDGDSVLIAYEYELTSGQRHRNTEILTVQDGKVNEIQVFFGGIVR